MSLNLHSNHQLKVTGKIRGKNEKNTTNVRKMQTW